MPQCDISKRICQNLTFVRQPVFQCSVDSILNKISTPPHTQQPKEILYKGYLTKRDILIGKKLVFCQFHNEMCITFYAGNRFFRFVASILYIESLHQPQFITVVLVVQSSPHQSPSTHFVGCWQWAVQWCGQYSPTQPHWGTSAEYWDDTDLILYLLWYNIYVWIFWIVFYGLDFHNLFIFTYK